MAMTNERLIKIMASKVQSELDDTRFRGETIIAPSVYVSLEHDAILFKTYDEYGNIALYYINFTDKYATRQTVSEIVIHEARDISDVIFR